MEGGDKVERRRDRLALAAILRGVPEEMHTMLLGKKSFKEAWEAIKTMRLGADRVKEVDAQKLLAEFESIAFKLGEAIDDFAVRISKLASDLRGLGETSVDDTRVVKFLRVVPSRYNQVAVAIEMSSDLKTLSIDEFVGCLRAAEDRFEPFVEQVTEKTGKLLLTEEEWTARNKSRIVPDSLSSSGGRGGGGRYVKKEKTGARGGSDTRDAGVKLTSMGTPRWRGKCCKCGIYRHFTKECLTKVQKEERHEAAHVAADGEAALVVAKCTVVTGGQHVFLNQERVFPAEYNDDAWILDTGATNHMTGSWEALTSLDETVQSAVRFGDGSMVKIQGIGAVTIAGKNAEHRVLTEVYYIPSLKCNIVSLGQLEENGCCVVIDNGVMEVFKRKQAVQRQRYVLIRAERKNRLYVMKVKLSFPVCLMTKMEEEAWVWHARFGTSISGHCRILVQRLWWLESLRSGE
jgi:hypothetical protein